MLAAENMKKLGRALGCSVCGEKSSTGSYFGFEDVLTSNVFGALRYLEPRYGLEPVLRSLDLGPIEGATVHFWQAIGGCEPDVIVDVGTAIVVVETKLNAPFGVDQLPREVLYAHQRAEGRPWRLLCVTDHAREPLHHRFSSDRQPSTAPLTTLQVGVASYFESVNETGLTLAEIGRRVHWMSWSDVADRLEVVRTTGAPPPHARALLDDVLASLDARGLRRVPFRGFASMPASMLTWTTGQLWASVEPARQSPVPLTWAIPAMTVGWRPRSWFDASRRFGGFVGAGPTSLAGYSGWFPQQRRASNG